MNDDKQKVFGIGFHKTGTTSLAESLSILGYRVTGPNGVHNESIETDVIPLVERVSKEYDAFQDNPWPLVYKHMDALYPKSKFILTIRPSDAWIKSVLSHFGNKETPMRKWIYGYGAPEGNEDTYIKRYEAHNQEVKEYFKDRPGDLLIFRITDGDGWEALCPFLGRDIPDQAFPYLNKSKKS